MSDPTTQGRGRGALAPPMPVPAPRSLALWYGLCGAPAAWSVQLLIDYALSAHACFPHQLPLMQPTVVPLPAVTGVIAAVMGLVSAGALVVAVRAWWSLSNDEQPAPADESAQRHLARARFMAVAGMMTGTLFTFGVLLNAISPALVPACW